MSPFRTLRTASLRVFRSLLRDDDLIKEMISQKVHFFIAFSLYQERAYEAERVQALKLTRKIMEIDIDLLPKVIVFALVAIASHKEDNLCLAALETLCEVSNVLLEMFQKRQFLFCLCLFNHFSPSF